MKNTVFAIKSQFGIGGPGKLIAEPELALAVTL